MTYLKNSTLLKIGYVFSAVTLLACLAQDTGVSGGYNIDNGTLHHDAVLVSAGHYTYDAVWVPGHFEYGHRWMEAHWGWVWNNDLHQQVWTWIEGSEYDYETWLDGYYYYPAVWHDAVWIPAYDEDLGDTWVEIGPSQISCVFCSIQTTPSGEVVSSPIIFQ